MCLWLEWRTVYYGWERSRVDLGHEARIWFPRSGLLPSAPLLMSRESRKEYVDGRKEPGYDASLLCDIYGQYLERCVL